MSIGTGIFLGALSISIVLLYGATKDRWHWRKIAKQSGFGFAALLVFLLFAGISTYIAQSRWPRNPRTQAPSSSVRFEARSKASQPLHKAHHGPLFGRVVDATPTLIRPPVHAPGNPASHRRRAVRRPRRRNAAPGRSIGHHPAIGPRRSRSNGCSDSPSNRSIARECQRRACRRN